MNPMLIEDTAYLALILLILALFFFIMRMKKGGD